MWSVYFWIHLGDLHLMRTRGCCPPTWCSLFTAITMVSQNLPPIHTLFILFICLSIDPFISQFFHSSTVFTFWKQYLSALVFKKIKGLAAGLFQQLQSFCLWKSCFLQETRSLCCTHTASVDASVCSQASYPHSFGKIEIIIHLSQGCL